MLNEVTLNVPDSIKSMCKHIRKTEGYRAAVNYMERQVELSKATGLGYVQQLEREAGHTDIQVQKPEKPKTNYTGIGSWGGSASVVHFFHRGKTFCGRSPGVVVHEDGDFARGKTRKRVAAVAARRHADCLRGIAQVAEGIGRVINLEDQLAVIGRTRQAHLEVGRLHRQGRKNRQRDGDRNPGTVHNLTTLARALPPQ